MDTADVRHMLISREGSVWNVMDVEPTMPHWRTRGISLLLYAFVIRTTTILLNICILHYSILFHSTFAGYSWPAHVAHKERLQKLERVAAEFYAQECSAERCSLKRSILRYVD